MDLAFGDLARLPTFPTHCLRYVTHIKSLP
jgi:hypothetical protein